MTTADKVARRNVREPLEMGQTTGFLNGFTNGAQMRQDGLFHPSAIRAIAPLGSTKRRFPARMGRFEKLKRKHMREKEFKDLTLDEIDEIRDKINGKKKQDDVDETLLRRLKIAELVLKYELRGEEFLANPQLKRAELAEVEKEFEEGRHLFEVHDIVYASTFKATLREIKKIMFKKASEAELQAKGKD